jgi:tetratricopeptide (TPR) repeat protein
LIAAPVAARAEGEGQKDLDEALRVKITAEGLRDLNQVIELLESALDKGLDVENSDFAEQVLSESLFERATELAAVFESVPDENLADRRMQRIQALAVSDLRRVLTYDNAPPQATALLAKLLTLAGGGRREARELLDQLIGGEAFAALPADEQAEALAQRAALQTEIAAALADFAQAIELAPGNVGYRLARAQYQFDHDKVDDALAEVAAIVEKTPDQVSAYLLQAQILRTVKRYEDALKALDKVIELAPGSIVPLEYRGEIYREMEQYDKAIEEFTRVLQIQPGLDLALLRRAEAYFLADKLDEALADLDAVLKDNPDLAVAHGLRAQVLASQERYADALAEIKLLAAELPGQPEVHMQLALYYLLNEQPREAIAAYSDVIELDDKHFLALRSRGDAYLNIGDHAAAIEDFERAYNLDAEDSALLNNLAWVLATSPDDNVRDGKRAIELAAKACELTEYKLPHIISTLAAAYAEAGDFKNAREWSQKSIALNQADLEAAIKEDNKSQIEKSTEMGPQLAAELEKYNNDEPMRERQTVEEQAVNDDGAGESADESAADAAADQESADEEASENNAEENDAADDSAPEEASAEPAGADDP